MLYIMVLNANIMSDSDDDEFVTARQITFKVKTDLERVNACIEKIENVSDGKYQFQMMYNDMLMLENKLEQGYKLSKNEKQLLNEVEEALQDVDFKRQLTVSEIRQLIREFKAARTRCGPVILHPKLKACDKKDGLCNFDIGDERIVYADLELQHAKCAPKLREKELRNFKIAQFICWFLLIALFCIWISSIWVYVWIIGMLLAASCFYIIFWRLDDDEDE